VRTRGGITEVRHSSPRRIEFNGAIVAARAQLAFPRWRRTSRWLVWVVAAYSIVGVVLNALTPSPRERVLWLPVAIVLAVCAVIVARGDFAMFQRVRLIESPMEVNPGIPLGSFYLVFSIYGLGWTTDLPGTLALVRKGVVPIVIQRRTFVTEIA